MTKTLTVEGDVNLVDTLTRLTTQGSVTAPSLKVPEGVSRIDRIIASCAADLAAAGSAVFILRLGGSAVLGGEQVLVLGAAGGAVPQAGSDQAPQAPQLFELDNVDIAVISDIISIAAEMCGSDLGDASVIVTLIFA